MARNAAARAPKPPRPDKPTGAKPGLHPRNRHRERYDFPKLIKVFPELGAFVAPNTYGDASIDFGDPAAVKTLNRALLAHFYDIQSWDIPPGYLCPPIPGRADYVHCLADLLATGNAGSIPRGASIRVLDIGVGASCIYPILGNREYGWRFIGSDIDARALASAQRILDANPHLGMAIELRLQHEPSRIFGGILKTGEGIDVCLCNPPFHESLRQAREGTERKWRNLGRAAEGEKPVLNFGGQGRELWCEGGESAFVTRMIEESAAIPTQCLWFTALVSKSSSLPGIRTALKRAGVRESRVIEMAQGQKQSRLVAWTFLDPSQHEAWGQDRWP